MSEELEQLREHQMRECVCWSTTPRSAVAIYAWQDRLMHLDSVTARELVKLHGELLAQEWVDKTRA